MSATTRQELEAEAKKALTTLGGEYNEDGELLDWSKLEIAAALAALLKTVDRYVEERERLVEADVRYQIRKSAPPVSNREWVDYDHFINNIWANWAISNKAMIGANGKPQFKALRQQVKGGKS